MKKILVPTDFSECAANALEFAVQSAKLIPAEITLLHAFDRQGSLYTDYMGVNREFTESLLFDVEGKMAAAKEDIRSRHGLIVNTLVPVNSLKDAILEATADKTFDLIIMGTTGAGRLKNIWGTNTANILSDSTIPVLVIPHAYHWKKPARFLIATERFELDPDILDVVFELAGLYMAQVQAAVFTDNDDEPAVFMEHGRKAPYYGQQLQERYQERELSTAQLFGNDFERSLEAHIDMENIDVLVMITYKKSFWERLFHPSMTRKMSYHSHIPLLVIPARR